MVQDDEPVGLDRVAVVFDDDRVVSDAGIVLVATLAQRLGLERLIVQLARLRADRRLEALAASGEGRGVEYQWITAERVVLCAARQRDVRGVVARKLKRRLSVSGELR